MPTDLLQQIAVQEHFQLQKADQLSGGSINAVYRLETSVGTRLIKINTANRYADLFKKEAEGLAVLRSANAFKIPEVYSVNAIESQVYLLMAYLPTTENRDGSWRNFAQSLADLHRHTATTFGLDHDNYIGSLPQYNQSTLTNAGEFYIENRLKPQFKLANQKGGFSFGNLDKFYQHIAYLIPDEKPALIHGDLWGENYLLTAEGKPALIDPAVAYAPREMDLAMMKLFGGFPDEAFSHYNAIFPLKQGWTERVDIWQLYYLLVHLNLFGQNYFHPVNRIISRFR